MSVAHYKGLRVKDLINFAKKHPQVLDYLPIEHEIFYLPRDYLCAVLVSLVPDDFAAYVASKMLVRHQQYQEKQNCMI